MKPGCRRCTAAPASINVISRLSPEIIADVMNGTKHSGSVFLPTGVPTISGPTTGQRMQHYAELAPPLAVAASVEAVRRCGLDAAELTHLVTVSCTGFVAPGFDVALMRALNLRPTIQRTHVGYMGCHGALNGLRVARAFAGADADARVLLCAVELCSLHYHYGWNPSKMIANALFADGAAALVGVPGDGAPADAWRVSGDGIVSDSRLDRRDDVDDRRPRFRDDAIETGAGTDRSAFAAVAGGLVGAVMS